MLASLINQQITEITRFDVLKQVHVLLASHAVSDAMGKQFIVCKHVFFGLAVKMTSLRWGDHG